VQQLHLLRDGMGHHRPSFRVEAPHSGSGNRTPCCAVVVRAASHEFVYTKGRGEEREGVLPPCDVDLSLKRRWDGKRGEGEPVCAGSAIIEPSLGRLLLGALLPRARKRRASAQTIILKMAARATSAASLYVMFRPRDSKATHMSGARSSWPGQGGSAST
jgi:hypothetical protein